MKIKLTIEYDGTKFFGWQKQDNAISVQETIEKAISKVFNTKDRIELFGAGRTDTGVHAKGQVAHFNIDDNNIIDKWKDKIEKLALAINFYISNTGCCIIDSSIVNDDFHARFSAKMRHYQYIIYNRNINSVILKNRVWHVHKKLDETKMKIASKYLIGTHNFNSFRSSHCGSNNPIRTISNIDIYRNNDNDDIITIDISAKSFLYNQVRITVGTLKDIATGKFDTQYIKYLLDKKDRTLSGVTAPPHGLYLTKIEY